MKQVVALSILSMIMLSACSFNGDSVTTRKIEDLEKQVQELKQKSGNSVFDKKVRCGMLSDEIEKKIENIQREYGELGKFSVGEIFYSPTKDACLWTRFIQTHSQDGSPSEKRALYQFGQDSGNSDPLIQCEKILTDKNGVNACEKWDAEVIKLKGEGAIAP